MARQAIVRRRSGRDWVVRIVLALLAAIAGYCAVTDAIAYSIRGSDPERAHALAPYDGRITAILSEQLAGPQANSVIRARSDQIARQALAQNGLAVSAVVTLGINAQLRGDTSAARRLFAHAQFLSRRDLRTQLWFIEDAVGRGNVPEVLHHYDIAMRTSRLAPNLLFPILGSASADPAVRTALIQTLATRPVWGNSFIDYMAGGGEKDVANGVDPGVSAQLFIGLRRAGMSLPDGSSVLVVNTLAAARRFDQAWAFYVTLRPGASRRVARDQRFRMALDTPAVFDWMPTNDASVTSSIQRNGTHGVFDFAAAPGAGGLLLRQMQLLPPGQYRVTGHSTGLDEPVDTLPYVTLQCIDGPEIGRTVIPASRQANGLFSGYVTVPSGCPVQYLSVIAQPSQSVSGLQGRLDLLALTPVK